MAQYVDLNKYKSYKNLNKYKSCKTSKYDILLLDYTYNYSDWIKVKNILNKLSIFYPSNNYKKIIKRCDFEFNKKNKSKRLLLGFKFYVKK